MAEDLEIRDVNGKMVGDIYVHVPLDIEYISHVVLEEGEHNGEGCYYFPAGTSVIVDTKNRIRSFGSHVMICSVPGSNLGLAGGSILMAPGETVDTLTITNISSSGAWICEDEVVARAIAL